jgi:hypothetical protein
MRCGLVLLLLAVVSASAGVITSSTMCSVNFSGYAPESVTIPSSCSLSIIDPADNSEALASASTGAFGTFGAIAQAHATSNGPDPSSASSSAMAESQTEILPIGIGPGYLEIEPDMSLQPDIDGGASASISFGGFSYECDRNDMCPYLEPSYVIPVTLGQPLLLTISVLAQGSGIGAASNETPMASAEADVSFQFLGADGVTQVGWTSVTPEPGTAGLCALALAAFAARKLSRRATRY